MYTTIIERTREIGVLKALGASKVYIVEIILSETTLLCAGRCRQRNRVQLSRSDDPFSSEFGRRSPRFSSLRSGFALPVLSPSSAAFWVLSIPHGLPVAKTPWKRWLTSDLARRFGRYGSDVPRANRRHRTAQITSRQKCKTRLEYFHPHRHDRTRGSRPWSRYSRLKTCGKCIARARSTCPHCAESASKSCPVSSSRSWAHPAAESRHSCT